ncbi:hypothetical protein RHGRI_021225 [Rhododendron griersonianum]|uniref:Retrotransposon Copia-like N-terminal domain-containing protein n=1 Tax=Rhododendron griersonianum TaxID=479676 RepID=A0AAV6JJP8_9ERIC|nr:hypothetical protein RHGRI_021225 [Rhododendron griersonianum]
MGESGSETSGTKSTPIIIQHEGSSFNAAIVLNETNYDLWSQMLEMHIAEKEKLSFIRGTSPPPTEKDEDTNEPEPANNIVSEFDHSDEYHSGEEHHSGMEHHNDGYHNAEEREEHHPKDISQHESFTPQAPHQSFAEDVPDLGHVPSRKQLPLRLTRGVLGVTSIPRAIKNSL